MTNTDLTTTEAAELERIQEAEKTLAAAGKSSLASFGATVPRIDVIQGTTKKPPKAGKLGDFYNTVTGAVFGTEISLLVAEAHKGRFLGGKRSPDGNTYAAGDVAIVPDHWPEQYRGQVFADLPEAQERYSQLVNEGTIEWGKGPAIQDSFNFTGFVIEAEAGEVEPFPVRLSLKSTSSKTAKTVGTMLRALPTLWSKSVVLATARITNADGEPFYVVEANDGYGREPTLQERSAAVEAALFAQQIGFLDAEQVPRETPGEGGTGDAPVEEGATVVAPSSGAEF